MYLHFKTSSLFDPVKNGCKVDQNKQNILLFFFFFNKYIRLVLGLCSDAHLRRQHHVNEANFNPCGILFTVKALKFC